MAVNYCVDTSSLIAAWQERYHRDGVRVLRRRLRPWPHGRACDDVGALCGGLRASPAVRLRGGDGALMADVLTAAERAAIAAYTGEVQRIPPRTSAFTVEQVAAGRHWRAALAHQRTVFSRNQKFAALKARENRQ